MQKTVLFLGFAAIAVGGLLLRYEYDDAKLNRIDRISGARQQHCDGEWLTWEECSQKITTERVKAAKRKQEQAEAAKKTIAENLYEANGGDEKTCNELAKRKAEGRLFEHTDKSVDPWLRWWGKVPEACAHLMPPVKEGE